MSVSHGSDALIWIKYKLCVSEDCASYTDSKTEGGGRRYPNRRLPQVIHCRNHERNGSADEINQRCFQIIGSLRSIYTRGQVDSPKKVKEQDIINHYLTRRDYR